jgi:hypothetical protein
VEHEDVCCGSGGLAHLGSFGSDFNGFFLEWVLEI